MKWFKLIDCFSRNLSEIKNRIAGRESSEFYGHSLKIMANPNNRNVNHWIDELFNFCVWIQRTKLKPNNKSIPRYLIDYFFEYAEDLEDFSKLLNVEYSNYHNSEKRKDKTNDQLLFNNYHQFCKEVADNLENKTLDIGTMSSLVNQYLILK
ncbi:MAG: hypothetical protein NC222_06685 [Staphylococcus sp.]|nr:hypothetical protein [Staphylococcus sp.]